MCHKRRKGAAPQKLIRAKNAAFSEKTEEIPHLLKKIKNSRNKPLRSIVQGAGMSKRAKRGGKEAGNAEESGRVGLRFPPEEGRAEQDARSFG